MKKLMLCMVAIAALFAPASRAQDLSGNWQGTLKTPNKDLRIILNFYKGDKDAWKREDVQHRPGRPADQRDFGGEAGNRH